MTRWLILIAAVVLLAAAAAEFWRRRRAAGRPSRGDIWWADVPFAEGRGGKLRPCLVLLNHRYGVVVLKITSQDKSHRRDHVSIPTRRWDSHADHDSYLNLGEPILVRHTAFQRRAGTAAWTVRRQVRSRRNLSGSRLRALAAADHQTRQNG